MAKSKKSLSIKQMNAIALILQGRSQKSVCEELEIGESTISIWNRDPIYRQEIETRQEQMFQEACGKVKASLTYAVDVLVELMQSPDDLIRLKAATKVIDTAIKFKELMDIEPRLKALEQAVEK